MNFFIGIGVTFVFSRTLAILLIFAFSFKRITLFSLHSSIYADDTTNTSTTTTITIATAATGTTEVVCGAEETGGWGGYTGEEVEVTEKRSDEKSGGHYLQIQI